jgi:hypothetical protein
MILLLSRWQFENCANTNLPHRWFFRLWIAAPNRNTPVSMFQTGTVMKIYNYRFLESYICWTTNHHRSQLCLTICQQRKQSKYFWPWSATINVAYMRDLIVLVFPKCDVLRLNLFLSFNIKTARNPRRTALGWNKGISCERLATHCMGHSVSNSTWITVSHHVFIKYMRVGIMASIHGLKTQGTQ